MRRGKEENEERKRGKEENASGVENALWSGVERKCKW
jgi:hypothetical protein